jgi:hypothetical protein
MDAVPDPALDVARSLREVFETLAGDPDPDAALAAAGYDGLPADLLTEAIANYAETAPPEVGEHLSPLLLGASPDSGLGLELLTSAPQVTWEDDAEGLAEEPSWADDGPPLEDLDFGAGDFGDGLDALDALDAPVDDVPTEVPATDVPLAAGDGGDGLEALADEAWADAWDTDAPEDETESADDLPDA